MATVAFRAIVLALISIAVSAQTFAQPPCHNGLRRRHPRRRQHAKRNHPARGRDGSHPTARRKVLTAMSEGDGTYRFAGLEAGEYRVSASLDGFDPKAIVVRVAYNQTVDTPLDLPIAGVAERVDVVAPQSVVPNVGTLNQAEVIGSKELEQLSPGGGFQAALRLIVSVIEYPVVWPSRADAPARRPCKSDRAASSILPPACLRCGYPTMRLIR